MSKPTHSKGTHTALWNLIKQYDGMPSREVAAILGVGKTTINEYRASAKAGKFNETPETTAPVIVTLDIESKPHLVYTWDFWNVNISTKQVKEYGGLLCFAAKRLGDSNCEFYSEWDDGYEGMVDAAHKLLSEADILVTYNGRRYDEKRLNNEFLRLGYAPPAPYKHVDLFQANKSRFDLPSKKLDYIGGEAVGDHKIENSGWGLWRAVVEDKDPAAREEMKLYNIQDVVLTENVYTTILPWIPNHPHLGMYTGDTTACPWCGGTVFRTMQNNYPAGVTTYELRSCENCGGWVRGTERMSSPLSHRAAR